MIFLTETIGQDAYLRWMVRKGQKDLSEKNKFEGPRFVSEPPVELNYEDEIEYPLLDIRDLKNPHVELRDHLPPETRDGLRPWERVVHIHEPAVSYPSEAPSAIVYIKSLTGNVATLSEIGRNGPSIASISIKENQGLEATSKYEVVHGRDALRVATDLHDLYPNLMEATILSLAEQQGLTDEEYRDGQPFRQEEPGRIMLLNRGDGDPVGKRFSEKLGWGWPFYGSIDATPSFVIAITKHLRYLEAIDPSEAESFLKLKYVDRGGHESSIKQALDLAVEWLLEKTASTSENPEGLVEFKNRAPKGKGGMTNQSWKDSAGAYVHADGEWANHEKGIASVEVQGLAYDALTLAAEHYLQLGKAHQAEVLEDRARRLKYTVLDKFWVEDERGGYFALATDRDQGGSLRPLKVRSSNMGQLLNSQLLKGRDAMLRERVGATIRSLFSPDMLSRCGIRTLSSREAAFRKEGYHTGSVWLWDNDAVGSGLENHGYHGLARYLWGLSLEVIDRTRMFPEFIQGGDSDWPELNKREVYVWDQKHEVLHLFEQIPQQIQAWSVSSALATKRRNFLVQLSHALEPDKKALEDELLASLPPISIY